MARKPAAKAPGQRQLRVGEVIRQALSEALARAHFREPVLARCPVTVTEVQPTPDLRHARVFVVPLGGADGEELCAALERAAPFLRAEVNRRVRLRFSPELRFELDRTFDHVAHIDSLLRERP